MIVRGVSWDCVERLQRMSSYLCLIHHEGKTLIPKTLILMQTAVCCLRAAVCLSCMHACAPHCVCRTTVALVNPSRPATLTAAGVSFWAQIALQGKIR